MKKCLQNANNYANIFEHYAWNGIFCRLPERVRLAGEMNIPEVKKQF